jgi:hypothetical protein
MLPIDERLALCVRCALLFAIAINHKIILGDPGDRSATQPSVLIHGSNKSEHKRQNPSRPFVFAVACGLVGQIIHRCIKRTVTQVVYLRFYSPQLPLLRYLLLTTNDLDQIFIHHTKDTELFLKVSKIFLKMLDKYLYFFVFFFSSFFFSQSSSVNLFL